MTSSFDGNLGSFVRTDYVIPEDEDQRWVVLRQYFNSLAAAINVKDTGYYVTEETRTGQLFLPGFPSGADAQSANAVYRPVLRRVVKTGTLSTGSNNVAHGITFPSPNTYHFTRIYGVIEDTSVPEWVPIPKDDVSVSVGTTNIVIVIPASYNGYTGQVVLEYVTTDAA